MSEDAHKGQKKKVNESLGTRVTGNSELLDICTGN